MDTLFGSDALASGYAQSRPPVHARVIDMVRSHLGLPAARVRRALDVGCGAGLSTRPLETIAGQRIGIEPAESMLKFAASVAPGASFAVGKAEQLPVKDGSIDLITAAGSLNYSDPVRFFPEMARVLAPGGLLVIYDFSPGRWMPGSYALDQWFSEFERRYPWPPDNALRITEESLREMAAGFTVARYEPFEIPLPLEPAFYIDYMMTETNVGYAVGSGALEREIRAWCAETLGPVFAGSAREVLFRGYVAYLSPASNPVAQ